MSWSRTGWGRTSHYRPGLKRIAKMRAGKKNRRPMMPIKDKPGGKWPPEDVRVTVGSLIPTLDADFVGVGGRVKDEAGSLRYPAGRHTTTPRRFNSLLAWMRRLWKPRKTRAASGSD